MSIDAERHPDYIKKDGKRSPENGINPDVRIHVLYGSVNIDGQIYRVKTTLKENLFNDEPKTPHSYEATKIELLAGTLASGNTAYPSTNNSITVANLLKGVEKSYGNGEKLLDDFSKVTDENGEPLSEFAAKTSIQMMFIGEQGAGRMTTEESRIAKVNSQFNEELQQQIDGTLPEGHIYQIGKPGAILRSAGFPDANIELSATRLAEKAAQRNHQFDIADVRNLPKALQNPIAVFAYGDKAKSENVIVGLNRDGKQFVVGVFFNQKRGGVEVSSVRGIFNKNNAEWLNWISQGKALYLDKEKIQALINQQRTNLADVEYLDLDDVTKIINSFENPTVEGKNHQDTGSDTGQALGDTPRYHIEKERDEKDLVRGTDLKV